MGHLRLHCPKVASAVAGGSRKSYPFGTRAVGVDDSFHLNIYCECAKSVGQPDLPPKQPNKIDIVGDGCVYVTKEVSPVGVLGSQDVCGPSLHCVKGRLRCNLSFWREELQASSFVLSTIESGYVLPLTSEPTPFARKNQASALQNAQFVQQSVEELLSNGCIRAVPGMPCICSPLSVVENSVGIKQVVINLRHLNRFLWKQRFKYEDLRVAMSLFEKGDYLFSFELKSGYHHIDIAEQHCKYLGFA